MPESNVSVPSRGDKIRLISGLVTLFFILILGIFIPLHTDEINWSYPNHRALADHLHVMTLVPQCDTAESFARPLPLSWYPHAVATNLLFMHMDHPLWIRIVGLMRFALFLAAGWFITSPLARHMKYPPGKLYILYASLLCLSPLPLLMEINRPEQSLFLGLAIFFALALNAQRIATHVIARWSAIVLFVVTVMLTFPVHPKAIALLPLALACTYVFFRNVAKKAWIFWGGMLATTGFALQCAAFWLDRYHCGYSDEMRQSIADNALPFNQLWTSPLTFIVTSAKTLLIAMMYDFNLYSHLKFGWQWLPYSLTPLPAWMLGIDEVLSILGVYLSCAVFVICVVVLIRSTITAAKRIADSDRASGHMPGQTDASGPAPFRLLGCAATISLLGSLLIIGPHRPFYAVSLEGPLLYLSGLLCLSAFFAGSRKSHVLGYASNILCVMAAISIVLIGCKYFPYITNPVTREKSDHGLVVLVSPWSYETQKADIEAAYRACNLPPVKKAQHLVLDDYTYPVLKHSFEPFSFDYLTNTFTGKRDIALLLNVMERYRSDGIILNCSHIPKSLRSLLAEHNGYCCASGSSIRR